MKTAFGNAALLLLFAMSLSGWSQNWVEIQLEEKILTFRPVQLAQGYELRVLGESKAYFERSFPAVSVPFFEPWDDQGQSLPNGTYRYELRVLTPESKADGAPVIMGQFEIQAGKLRPVDSASASATNLDGFGLFPWENGRLGMGTAAPDPSTQLHLSSAAYPALRMEYRGETIAQGIAWDFRMNQAGLLFQNRGAGKGTDPVFFANGAPDHSFYLTGTGAIGLGTNAPAARLEIQATDSGDVVRIRNRANQRQRRNVLTLENYGEVAFQMVMQPTGDIWSFLVREEDFLISRNGSRAEEFRITETGTVYTHGSINPKSDRAAKENFQAVNGDQILESLKAMPIQSWTYKSDAAETRHLGPTSQDFHAAFSLGQNDGSISVLDSSGVALVAIQALEARLASKEQEVAHLRHTNEQLSQRLTDLEAQMKRLLMHATSEK